MAEDILSSSEPEDDEDSLINIDLYLHGQTGLDTIHNGACALAFINELWSEYGGESTSDDVVLGRWLVLSTIVLTIRRGQQQLMDERDEDRELRQPASNRIE